MKKNRFALLLCSSALLGVCLMMGEEQVAAHGYVESPPSRGYQGALEKDMLSYGIAFDKYGGVINNPQSLEAKKGFPDAGPADGHIASAEGGFGQIGDLVLDKQTSDRWTKQTINQGPMNFTWLYTAAHSTSKWHYYMTKPGWDPNDPLDRDDLELIGTIKHDGSDADTNLSHTINIPKNRLGYHIVLAVWDVADTPNAFYNVIDVNVKGEAAIPTAPSAPKNVRATNVTSKSVTLMWNGQSNTISYNIYRNGLLIGNSVNAEFVDTNLKEKTTYLYEIEAVGQGDLTSKKTAISVTTVAQSSEEKPTAPKHLHAMETTSNSVSLMWGESSHTQGIKRYEIYRDGKRIGSTSTTVYNDSELAANTTYTYTVKAISNSNESSDSSNALKITTAKKEEEVPEIEGRQWVLGSFSNPQLYTTNKEVIYKGKRYITLQTHVNYGDSTWAPDQAPILFRLIS
ncbi:lytic polysaccharide monooxygenase [Enterococcus ratti]|uniref:Chitin binding domain-containing protein n=1 Tax=Enterococcus ratti TaxID=150033 RepID=A0A1L8WKZ8_9ENTE|nr:lytic polysaccharide monooxygenase [Enterococcus ratti]OJG81691.1 chitin binding domain-containing protein [Enterococcus ratti]